MGVAANTGATATILVLPLCELEASGQLQGAGIGDRDPKQTSSINLTLELTCKELTCGQHLVAQALKRKKHIRQDMNSIFE